MTSLKDKKIVFAGCARDCAAPLPAVLANIETIAGWLGGSAFIFVEDNSKDDTRQILAEWCGRRAHAHILSSPPKSAASSIRSVRVGAARNTYLAFAREQFGAFDDLVMMDMDYVSTSPIGREQFTRALEFLDLGRDRAAVFGNCLGTYYDMWAFRHPVICPDDPWAEIGDYVCAHGVTDEEAFAQTFAKRIFHIPPDEEPLEVESAFGGFGIYKFDYIRRNPRTYSCLSRRTVRGETYGWVSCEHVSFHAGLRALGGRLFVLPYLINCHGGPQFFTPSRWRNMRL
jgi:hypothetical protein